MSAKPQMQRPEKSIVERKFDFRSEEAGATLSHNRLTRNLGGLIWQHLRGKDCESFTSDLAVKVKTHKNTEYTYPDVVVACRGARFTKTRDGKSQIENPVLIIEVLSHGSPDDLTAKFEDYKQLDSLVEYLVVYQDRCKIRHWIKDPTAGWKTFDFENQDDLIILRSISLGLRLKEIYEKCEISNG